jgi:hypothetical protein
MKRVSLSMDEKQRHEKIKAVMIWLRCSYGLMMSVAISISLQEISQPGSAFLLHF